MTECNSSFNEWFFSKNDLVEKSIGIFIFFGEILTHCNSLFSIEYHRLVIDCLNAGCLLYIYIYFNNILSVKYSISNNHNLQAEIGEKNLLKLINESNTCIKIFSCIKYFILY